MICNVSFRSMKLLTILSFFSLLDFGNARIIPFGETPNFLQFELTLTWEDAAPDGTVRKAILMNNQLPGPTLRLKQHESVQFLVRNLLPVSTAIHFHGIDQLGTPWSDGVPGLSQRAIQPGESFMYRWTANSYGSYFYHAHSRGQLMDGLFGAIYVEPSNIQERPFKLISSDESKVEAMLQAERQTRPLILSDWRHLTSEQVWEAEVASGLDAPCVNSLLINGKGSVNCFDQNFINQMTSPAVKALLQGNNLTDIACPPPFITNLEGSYGPVNYSAIPFGLFSGCRASQGRTEVFNIDPSEKYVSWDIISASGTKFMIFSIDQHSMWIYAIDGHYIDPSQVDAIKIATGSRYSVLVELNKPANSYAMRVVDAGIQIVNATAVLSYKRNPLDPTTLGDMIAPSETPHIDVTGAATSDSVEFSNEFGFVPYPDCKPPLLFNRTAITDSDLRIITRNGTWVDIIITNPLLGQPTHAIHKHSNKFYVIGHGFGDWNYTSVAEAMEFIPDNFDLLSPQLRDTFVVEGTRAGRSWLAIRYQVVNPGAFIIHCHIQPHLSGGMAMAILDGVDAWPQLPPYQLTAR
ncbi:laccase-1 [Penicillium cosmopolitanum]|uniref:Laccase-1 n=1 Tax=Penicillium cosmopolitanum TaxID=1131564 RepID=A0A9W9SJN6_9EURO|nr:laccase-1 [Penicillium cosmopolitanum]KAJ5378929.1 laccase-1 [Penicillium cosmopolitanum]